MNDSDAFNQGKQAWRDDLAVDQNPHIEGSREWKLWRDGWMDLEKHFAERSQCIEW